MKVLIFTATVGNGHNATANVLKAKFEQSLGAEVKIVDAYKTYASWFYAWTLDKGYIFACNHLVPFYNYFFKKSEKSTPENRNKTKAHNNTYPIAAGMLKEIMDFKPDLIVSTYIFVSVALNDLKNTYNIPAKIMTLTLDYGVSPYWECTNDFDYLFISGDYMKEDLLRRGFNEKQLYPLGIPIKDIFSTDIDKTKMRKELGLDEKLFTLTIMKSGFFSISDKKMMKELEKVKQKIQVVIINGKSGKNVEAFEKLIKKTTAPHIFHTIGFTDKVGEIFSASDLILGKAGGLTVTEAITKGLPSLIVNKLPQQEIYNKDYAINNGCALEVNKKDTISKQIEFLLSNPDELEKMQQNCKKIRKLFVADKMMNILKDIPAAKYENLVSEEEPEVNRKIKTMLKKRS